MGLNGKSKVSSSVCTCEMSLISDLLCQIESIFATSFHFMIHICKPRIYNEIMEICKIWSRDLESWRKHWNLNYGICHFRIQTLGENVLCRMLSKSAKVFENIKYQAEW